MTVVPEIREMREEDIPELLILMRALARFEDYLDDFAVTETELRKHGLGAEPLFHAFVADTGSVHPASSGMSAGSKQLVGMAITYVVPWTYTLRPRLVLKELYVDNHARGMGIGRRLMSAVYEQGRGLGCDHVAWTVMEGNTSAERFYSSIGGQPDAKWNNWTKSIPNSC